jgi:hypothetical protein
MTTYLTLQQASTVARDLAVIEKAVGEPALHWGNRCHEISLKVLRTGLFGPGRVARGMATSVTGQHSWIVLGADCYDPAAVLVDPTIGPLHGEPVIGVYLDNLAGHVPHGAGSIWQYGPPGAATGPVIELPSFSALSGGARRFLELAGYPFDYGGWCQLASSPVQGWPAAEIITAIYRTPQLTVTPPIDHVGMLTDENPKGLYR